MTPKVSVIIPVYNGEIFIEDCIKSVLGQTYGNLEVIVVDDGSTDNTENIIKEKFPSVICMHQANKGPAAARNLGLMNSTGDYIAFLDADDLWLPDKIFLQMELILGDAGMNVVHTNLKIRNNGKLESSIYPMEQQGGNILEPLLLQRASVVCSTVLLRKECLQKVGVFDEGLRTAEDVHLFLRLAYYYEYYFVDKVCVIKNHHDSNLTNPNNVFFGSGTFSALEKFENEFPQYSRSNSEVMRQAFFQRLRLRTLASAKRGDMRAAMTFLIEALKYNKRIYNILEMIYKMANSYYFRTFR